MQIIGHTKHEHRLAAEAKRENIAIAGASVLKIKGAIILESSRMLLVLLIVNDDFQKEHLFERRQTRFV